MTIKFVFKKMITTPLFKTLYCKPINQSLLMTVSTFFTEQKATPIGYKFFEQAGLLAPEPLVFIFFIFWSFVQKCAFFEVFVKPLQKRQVSLELQ